MNNVLGTYDAVVEVTKRALFWLAVVLALLALVDWLARTRRINPFGIAPRFLRRYVDPLLAPLERRVVRAGGLPSATPWWALVAVVVGGILLITLLQYFGELVGQLLGANTPGRLGRLLAYWTVLLLQIALIVRVVSSWVRISPYSRWIHWSFVLTEWMLGPLRRVVPELGPIDITPVIAYFVLMFIGGQLRPS